MAEDAVMSEPFSRALLTGKDTGNLVVRPETVRP